MIRRHIDLIAVAFLLFGMALFSVANRSAALGCLAVKYHCWVNYCKFTMIIQFHTIIIIVVIFSYLFIKSIVNGNDYVS